MTDDLLKRLRKRKLGVMSDAYEAIYEVCDRIEQLEACLELRDAFIVSKGLWVEFVDSAALAGEKKDV